MTSCTVAWNVPENSRKRTCEYWYHSLRQCLCIHRENSSCSSYERNRAVRHSGGRVRFAQERGSGLRGSKNVAWGAQIAPGVASSWASVEVLRAEIALAMSFRIRPVQDVVRLVLLEVPGSL